LGDDNPRQTNRELVYQYLENDSFVTDADRLMAEDIKEYFKGYTFKVLSGAYLSEFDRNTMRILEEEFTPEGYNLALLASIPNNYLKAKKRDEADRRTRFAQGGYVGKVGERLNLQVEVIKCVFSQKWGIYYITAMTTSDQAIFFGYKQEVATGTILNIDGTVKRQDNNQTQLNRVKVK
jgi:small-conductance mechanosensitive channel